MKPILFAGDETDFTTNGLGRLDCIACVVEEERNGAYELALEISMDTPHAAEIALNSIIGAVPCDGGTVQAFRVYEITKPTNGKFTVYARHISYDLSRIPCMPFQVESSATAAAETMAALKTNAAEACPFTFWTDLTTAAGYNQPVPASIRSRLGGVQGSVLDQFGGEYEWDNYTVKLHSQRGRINTGISLRYGKNITDIRQEENIASTVTGICPYWQSMDEDGETVTLTEKVVYSQYAESYPLHLTEVMDFSSKFDEAPTEEELRTAAQAYVNQSKLGEPKVSIDVSFIALWQTEEYKDIAPLQRVKLCDEITVDFEKLGIRKKAKVVKTVYDVLAERYNSVEVGEIRSTLATTLNDRESDMMESVAASNLKTYRSAVNNATAWLTGANGYVVAVKDTDGSWKELLFMDTNDPEEAVNVLRINTNGIGFSTNGIAGPYNNAWTIDGKLIADFIKVGTLEANNGVYSLNMDTGEVIMKSGIFGSGQNWEITTNGLRSKNGPTASYGQNTKGTYVGKDGFCCNGDSTHVWISDGAMSTTGGIYCYGLTLGRGDIIIQENSDLIINASGGGHWTGATGSIGFSASGKTFGLAFRNGVCIGIVEQ